MSKTLNNNIFSGNIVNFALGVVSKHEFTVNIKFIIKNIYNTFVTSVNTLLFI